MLQAGLLTTRLISLIVMSLMPLCIYAAGTTYCPYPDKDKSHWCGGGHAGTVGEMSCTPFPYRPWAWANEQSAEGKPRCVTENWGRDRLTGGKWGAKAWASFGQDGKLNDNHYFVFHACDGAGIQTDCAGDIYFVEQFGSKKPEKKGASCDDAKNGIFSANMRNRCDFTHPGTGTTYERPYNSGWWTNNSKIPNWMVASKASGPWGPNGSISDKVQAIKNPFEGQQGIHITFILFPWVCHKEDPPRPELTQFTGYPNVNCYADNEPLSDGKGFPGWPPTIDVYFMLLTTDAQGKDVLRAIWINGLDPSKSKKFNLYACHKGDGCPW